MRGVGPALLSKAKQPVCAPVGAPEEGNAGRIVLVPVLEMGLGFPLHLSRWKSRKDAQGIAVSPRTGLVWAGWMLTAPAAALKPLLESLMGVLTPSL